MGRFLDFEFVFFLLKVKAKSLHLEEVKVKKF